MVNITPILEAIISLCAALITVFLIPWIKSKASESQLSKAVSLVDIMVTAAEQMAPALGWNGDEKKEYVIKRLGEMGYSIDMDLNDYIEACVLNLHNEIIKKTEQEFPDGVSKR